MQISFDTGRLHLRAFQPEDALRVQSLLAAWEMAAPTANMPHPYPEGAAEAWIASQSGEVAERKRITYAVTQKSDGLLIGAASLHSIQLEHQRAELGYWVGREFWGQGYCTEAILGLMDFARAEMGITRIEGRCVSWNEASARVMEKCGMVQEGCLRQHAQRWGKFEDILLFGRVFPERVAGQPGGELLPRQR